MASRAVTCDSGKAGGEKSFIVLRQDPGGVDKGMNGMEEEEGSDDLAVEGGREDAKVSSRVTSQSLTDVEETPGSSEPTVIR